MKPTTPAIVVSDWSDPTQIQEVLVDTSRVVDGEYLQTTADLRHVSSVVPIKYRDKAIAVVAKRAALKKAFDDSIAEVYNLRNEIARDNSRWS